MLSIKNKDYLEAIFKITKEKGYAMIRDISSLLGVAPASTAGMVKRLNDKGLLIHEKYDGVTLTPEGEEIVILLKERRDALRAFLKILDVPEEIADVDASIIEHELYSEIILHSGTMNQIKNLVNFVRSAPDHLEWTKDFQIFCKTG
ncbi:MAG: manganese transport transcriptional regulator [Candidatus Methanolliviera sp. GoM_oil]|nr:MAG: manganese transport transcriptional regulator [Candidatus Methanolliviera sp. GoM_oil]